MSNDFLLGPINTDLGSIKTFAEQSSLSRASDGVRSVTQSDKISQSSFADTLSSAATDFVQTVNKAEATSIAGLKGDASVYEVATAVMEAERALRMTVAVRDKIVSAYLDISRMQI